MAIGKKLLKAGLGKLGKGFRKGFQKVLNKIAKNSKLKNALGGCPGLTKLSKRFGTGVSHPADVASGHFYTDNVDFALPGMIPFEFERNYYSYSDFHGPLGIGWHHTYDMALALDEEEDVAAFRMSDGRTTGFEIPARGKAYFNRREKLWLHRTEEEEYYVTDLAGLIYRFEKQTTYNPFNNTTSHLLQSISNRNGYALRFRYDMDGILVKAIDTAGRNIEFTGDGKGHIIGITIPGETESDPRILISRYAYDAHNRLISQTDALGHTMHFNYDGTLLTKEVWRNGLTWHIRYKGTDKEAKCIEITGDNDLFHYHLDYVAPDCTVVTDSLGQKTTYYHRMGFVVKRIDPNGGVYEYVYNDDNELLWTVDPLGRGSGETQDAYGNLVTKTEADGGFTHIKYENPDFVYLPSSATDAAGGKWSWTYDESGNLTHRTDPMGAVTEFSYTDGLLTSIKGAAGQQTTLHYDKQANLIKAVAPDGGTNRWWYDNLGQCLKHQNAKEGITEYSYDLLGQVTIVKETDGNVRELTYDKEGNVTHAKDTDRDVRFTYRGVNKLSSRTERGASLRFLYDTEDQLRAVVNEQGEEYRFELDAQGDVIKEIGFDGLTRSYSRDLAGQVTQVVQPNKKEIAYGYDPVGRVTQVIYHPNRKEQTEESYEYRRDGALIKAVNEDAVVELTRDKLGRVIKETCNGVEINNTYDTEGNRTQITSTLGADIRADYNLMGDVIGLASGGWQTQYQRDLFGLETGRTIGGNVRTRTERDKLGRVTGHKIEKNNRHVSEKNYLWGSNDKLLGIITDGKAKHFEYDGWGNLSKTVFEDGSVERRNPDKSGNLFESLDRMDRKYAKGGQLIQTERWQYKYDGLGNLIRKKGKDGQVWRYEWNEAGMLKRVKRPDSHEVTFKYDALGRRIEKRLNKHITRWVWDGNVPLHEVKETHEKDYSEEQGYFTSVTAQPTITWVFEEGTFVPTAKLTEQKKLSIVTNYLGTPEAMYGEEGEKVWSCELNSYGRVRSFEGQYKTECPFRYQGQYEDAETGLYYNRFRYYSPEEGMYLSQDPIGLAGGTSLYEYVGDLNGYIDMFGLHRMPKSDGQWSGKRGNSTWKSNNNEVNEVTGGKGVKFRNNYPDFSPYSKGDYNFNDLDGTDKDFDKVYERIQKDKNLKSKNAAKNWLKKEGLTPHHHQNGRTIQLIPTKLHANVPHAGGASKLRKKKGTCRT